MQHRQSSPRGTPLKFGWNRGGSSQQETCNIYETGQNRPRLLLMTNIAYDWCQNHRPWTILKAHITQSVSKHVRLSESTTKIWMKIDPYNHRRRYRRYSQITLDSGKLVCADIPRGSMERGRQTTVSVISGVTRNLRQGVRRVVLSLPFPPLPSPSFPSPFSSLPSSLIPSLRSRTP